MECCDFSIAGLLIRVEGRGSECLLGKGFEVFQVPISEGPLALRFCTDCSLSEEAIHTLPPALYSFDFFGIQCCFHTHEKGHCFVMQPQGKSPYALWYERGNPTILSNICAEEKPDFGVFRFMLWIAIGLAFLPNRTLAIHSSVAVHSNKAVLYVAESGTGKSTQTRLWRENIPGTGLLNDDSPMLKITQEGPMIYGSPWSGKMPVYINESYPAAAFVRVVRAPFNRLTRLNPLAALGALLPSCAPEFMYNENLTDDVCRVLSSVLKTVPIYTLECLPNAQAAYLVYDTLKKEGRL